MTNTNPYVCSENNLNTPECISVPYENSEESIEMYGDYDNMQGFDHTLQTDAKSEFHKFLKENHFKATDGKKTNKNFTKWRKNLPPATRENYLKLHDEHKKKHPPKQHNANEGHLKKAEEAYHHMNAEYKKFYVQHDRNAWLDSRKILQMTDDEKKQKMTENFMKNYLTNKKQMTYLNKEGENNTFVKTTHEELISFRRKWMIVMADEEEKKFLFDYQKGIERNQIKEEEEIKTRNRRATAAGGGSGD